MLFKGLEPENRRRVVRLLKIPECCLSQAVHSRGACGSFTLCYYCKGQFHHSLLCYAGNDSNWKIFKKYKRMNMRMCPNLKYEEDYASFQDQVCTVDVVCDSEEWTGIPGNESNYDENCTAAWESDDDGPAPAQQGVGSGEARPAETGDDNQFVENNDTSAIGASQCEEANKEKLPPPGDRTMSQKDGEKVHDRVRSFFPMFSCSLLPEEASKINKQDPYSCKYSIYQTLEGGKKKLVELEQQCPGISTDKKTGFEQRYWEHILDCPTMKQLNELSFNQETWVKIINPTFKIILDQFHVLVGYTENRDTSILNVWQKQTLLSYCIYKSTAPVASMASNFFS